eukprot:Nk52_evm38s292 gene=Nk52_evmTU38s292
MSFRDLRNFGEMLRALGYPRQISLDNFRNPNFPLVAEILNWLVKKYEPNEDILMEIDREEERIIFIKSVVEFMAKKAHLKLNPKKLYSADGYAVKEMIKVASVLYESVIGCDREEDSIDSGISSSFDLNSKLGQLKEGRHLANEITSKGANLYELLGKEVELREKRIQAVSRPLEISDIERGIKDSINNVHAQIKQTNQMLDNLGSDEANLETKIEKKRMDLERNEKRLHSLQSVRPAFMDEYERLEMDLQQQYEIYLMKFRNLTYLEHLLQEHEKIEQEKLEESEQYLKKMQNRLREEELKMLRGEGGITAEDDELLGDMANGGELNFDKVYANAPGAMGDGGGSMMDDQSGSDDDEDEDELIDLDDDDDDSELSDDDDDDDDLSDDNF